MFPLARVGRWVGIGLDIALVGACASAGDEAPAEVEPAPVPVEEAAAEEAAAEEAAAEEAVTEVAAVDEATDADLDDVDPELDAFRYGRYGVGTLGYVYVPAHGRGPGYGSRPGPGLSIWCDNFGCW